MTSRVIQYDSSGNRLIGPVEVPGDVQLYTLLVDASVAGDAPGELAPGLPGMIWVPVGGFGVSDAPAGVLTTAPIFQVGLMTQAFGFGEMGVLTPFDTTDPADWAKNSIGGGAFAAGLFTGFPSGEGQPAAVRVATASVGLANFPVMVCVLGMYVPAFA